MPAKILLGIEAANAQANQEKEMAMSEVLNEEDLDWLTRTENRLAAMRKRESEHHPRSMLGHDFTDAIKSVHTLRQMLQARFEKEIDDDL